VSSNDKNDVLVAKENEQWFCIELCFFLKKNPKLIRHR